MNFWQAFRQEFQTFIKDPGAILIMVVGVFLYPLVYSSPYSNEIVKDVPISVIDMDNTVLSREMIREIGANDGVEIKSESLSFEHAKNEFLKNKTKGIVVIPNDFEKNIMKGKKTNLALYSDSAYLIVYKQVSSAVQTVAANMSAKIEAVKLMKMGMSKDKAISNVLPFNFVQNPLYNPAGGYLSYIYPVVIILIMQQTLLIGLSLVCLTKKERKKSCSLSPVEIFTKGSFYTLIYSLYGIIYIWVLPGGLSYKSSFNCVVFFVLPLFLYAVVFLAQSVTGIFKEREDTIMTLTSTSVFLLLMSGFIWPKEAMPIWINLIAYLIPSTYATDIIVRINQMDASFSQVAFSIFCLAILCIGYFFLACFVNRKRSAK